MVPFYKERLGWTDSDRCWWCGRGTQSRENLFKECTARRKEIKELWTAVGEASGGRGETGDPLRSRKGFGYRVRQARARPSNTSARDLLSDDRYIRQFWRSWGQRGLERPRKEQFVHKCGRLRIPIGLRPGMRVDLSVRVRGCCHKP